MKEILCHALELPADLRQSYIEHEAAGDQALRNEVCRLVELQAPAAHFMVTPALVMDSPPSAPKLGDTIIGDRYRIESILGEGGFGVAYRARDATLADRLVVLKILRPGLLSREFARSEISALARLDHPNIVGILDAGTTDDGQDYLVLRYVSGQTLRELLRSSPVLPAQNVEMLARQIGEALLACHEAGLLHLDLKPENIVVSPNGPNSFRVTILDFGTALVLGGSVNFVSAKASGNPYRAPELNAGKAPSPACDVYSLAKMLAEALTGEASESRPVHKLGSVGWQRLIEQACAPDPAARLRNMHEFLDRIPKRHAPIRILLATGGLAALLMLAILASRPPRDAGTVAIPRQFTALPGEEIDPSFSHDGEVLYYAWIAPGEQQATIFSRRITDGAVRKLTSDPGGGNRPIGSPDGKWVAFFREHKDYRSLIVMPVAGGVEQEVAQGPFHTLNWSPDSQSLAIAYADRPGAPSRVNLLNIATGQWKTLTSPSAGIRGDRSPVFSPDGAYLAFVRMQSRVGGSTIFLQKLNTGLRPVGDPQLVISLNHIIEKVAFSPDGRTLLFLAGTASRKSLWSIPAAGGKQARQIVASGFDVDDFAVSPHDWRVAFVRSSADMNIWRATLNSPYRARLDPSPLIASTQADEEPRVSGDGRSIAFVSQRSGEEQIWLSKVDGNGAVQLSRLKEASDLAAFWSANPDYLLVAGSMNGNKRSLLLSTRTGETHEIGAGFRYTASGWSRDGNWVYHTEVINGQHQLLKTRIDGQRSDFIANGKADFVIESIDGRSIYFCSADLGSALWRVQNGQVTQLLDGITHKAFAVSDKGLYFVTGLDMPSINFYRFADGAIIAEVLKLDRRYAFGLDLTPDLKTLVFAQYDQRGSDVFLIDDIRIEL